MRTAARAIVLVVALACALPALAQDKLPPVDEGAADPSWTAFRNRLLNALQKRDRKFLLGITDRNVRNSTAGERGIKVFQEQWELASDASPIWRELPSALFLGSAYLKRDKGPRELCAPYVLARWPADIDPFGHGAIVSKEAVVKKEPSAASATVETLSYDIVAVTDWEVEDRDTTSPQHWVRIRTRTAEGYVPEEHVRSPIEHAACFVKGPSGWRMVAFAPAGGD